MAKDGRKLRKCRDRSIINVDYYYFFFKRVWFQLLLLILLTLLTVVIRGRGQHCTLRQLIMVEGGETKYAVNITSLDTLLHLSCCFF